MTDQNIDRALVLTAARAAHEVNRAFARSLGDTSHVSWEDTPDDIRRVVYDGVEGILVKDDSPERSHERWCNNKRAQGWVYGAAKDADAKTHPCLVPYGDLPIEQQIKDQLFYDTVKSVASAWWRRPT